MGLAHNRVHIQMDARTRKHHYTPMHSEVPTHAGAHTIP